MHKEVCDVQICFSHKVHLLRYLKTAEEKKQLYFSTQFTIGREV